MFKTKEEKLRQIPKYSFSNKNIKPRFTINQVVLYPVGSTIEKIKIKHIRVDVNDNGDVQIKYYASAPREGVIYDRYYLEKDLYLSKQEIIDEIGKR